jgi:flagellar biosynthesis GTPase FlhF
VSRHQSRFLAADSNSVVIDRIYEESRANQRLLYTIPNSPVPIESVVSYIHKWASEATSTGSSIKSTTNDKGVLFSFSPSPSSYLHVFVDNAGELGLSDTEGATIFIRTSFGLLESAAGAVEEQKKKVQVHSLVKMVAQNLIESLANDIGSLIMNLPESSIEKELSPAEREEQNLAELEMEQEEYENNMQEEDDQLLRAQVHAEQQAEQQTEAATQNQNQRQHQNNEDQDDSEMRKKERLEFDMKAMKESLLTEKEMMKEWTADVITDEENRQFIEEMRIRNSEKNNEDFEFDASLFDNESLGISDIDTQEDNVDIDTVEASIVEVEDSTLTKPYVEESVRASVNAIVTTKIENVAPVLIDTGNMDNTVYSWKSVDTEKDVIISFIQGVYSFVVFLQLL